MKSNYPLAGSLQDKHPLQRTLVFRQSEKRLGATRRTETSLLNGAEIKYAWQAKSHNFYRFGKSNYARRSLHTGGRDGGAGGEKKK